MIGGNTNEHDDDRCGDPRCIVCYPDAALDDDECECCMEDCPVCNPEDEP